MAIIAIMAIIATTATTTTMMKLISFSPLNRFAATALAVVSVVGICGCSHVDNHRLPRVPVNIVFWTSGDWVTHGVSGAALYKRFIIEQRIPSDYNYTAGSATGFGGVLLCTTYAGEPIAYDLACPYEATANNRVFINDDNLAECPRCHSCFDVFGALGNSISGPARDNGYGMTVYSVGPGRNGEYMVVSNL